MTQHQYVLRHPQSLQTETLFADHVVRFLYSRVRESAPWLFRTLTSAWASQWLGYINFDLPLGSRLAGNHQFLRHCGLDLSECVQPASYFTSARKIFERQIRYWQCRPLPDESSAIVSPADARLVTGSLAEGHAFFVKDKFFSLDELLAKPQWIAAIEQGDFAILRLTPEQYHYNHAPVSGRVLDIYPVTGGYHSCNPNAIVHEVTPFSKNKRGVTIIDTNVPDGSQVGLVAMIEVVALMIGEIVQCYSEHEYQAPQPLTPGMFIRKGQVKSLYRPGSSTDIVLFQPQQVRFAPDLIHNQQHPEAYSRFSDAFAVPLVETELQVRSAMAFPLE